MKDTPKPFIKNISTQGDRSACGHYRILWPNSIINARSTNAAFQIHTLEITLGHGVYYKGVSTVRVQRLLNEDQLEYFNFLKEVKEIEKFKIVYDVDDIIDFEEIPQWNHSRSYFERYKDNLLHMMKESDEITVPSKFMADFYKNLTGNKNVTVLPNYVPRFWLDRFYSPQMANLRYRKHKRKPLVLFIGSSSHFDWKNLNNQIDDYSHITESIAKTVNDFNWTFLGGCIPEKLKSFVLEGKIKLYEHCNIYDFPYLISNLMPSLVVSPLFDNVFNRAKSDIKLKECNALGLPNICQDLDPYENAKFKFSTGDEMIDLIKKITKNEGAYAKNCNEAWKQSQSDWLENMENFGKFVEIYQHPFGSPERKLLQSITYNAPY